VVFFEYSGFPTSKTDTLLKEALNTIIPNPAINMGFSQQAALIYDPS
jgi:hypothetical protein